MLNGNGLIKTGALTSRSSIIQMLPRAQPYPQWSLPVHRRLGSQNPLSYMQAICPENCEQCKNRKQGLTFRRLRLPATLLSASSMCPDGMPTDVLRFHFLPLRRYDVSKSSSVLSKLMSEGDKIDADASPIGSNPLKYIHNDYTYYFPHTSNSKFRTGWIKTPKVAVKVKHEVA